MTNFEERDPAEVRRELRWQRAAATVLFHRLAGNAEGEAAGMELVLQECHTYGVTPSQVLLEPVLTLVSQFVMDIGRERLSEGLQGIMVRYSGIPGPDGPP